MTSITLNKNDIIRILKNNLNVSDATVNNWIKLKLIPENLTNNEIDIIIHNFKKNKLISRANKINSKNNIIPFEYIKDKILYRYIKTYVDELKNKNISINNILFNTILYFLFFHNEIEIKKEIVFKRTILQKLLLANKFDFLLNDPKVSQNFIYLDYIFNSNITDPLGAIYQYLLFEGNKIKLGSYYTPSEVVTKILNKHKGNISTFMDPCCGTGSFLLKAVDIFQLNPNNILGFDIDPLAVLITKINLYIKFKDFNNNFYIFHQDFLNYDSVKNILYTYNITKIDLIATNPPWRTILKDQRRNINNFQINELFTGFLYVSILLLNENKEALFLLPESFLNIRKHKNIRSFIIENCQILSIENLNRIFTNVYTKCIILHLKKNIQPFYDIEIINSNLTNLLSTEFINKNKYKEININVNNEDIKIIDKIYLREYKTLKNNAKWALGIVTGNNSQLTETQNDGQLPIVKGVDISPFIISKPNFFIKFEPDKFQQIAKNNLYFENEKLIYKFISNNLIFAYDNNQYLTLNSANILIPEFDDISIKTVLAFMNSEVFNYLHKKLYSTHKILRGNLESLPFPKINLKDKEIIEKYVNSILNCYKNTYLDKINEIIFNCFELEPNEIYHIKNNLQIK